MTKDGQSTKICPYDDENYLHEYIEHPFIFDQLYSVMLRMLIIAYFMHYPITWYAIDNGIHY